MGSWDLGSFWGERQARSKGFIRAAHGESESPAAVNPKPRTLKPKP